MHLIYAEFACGHLSATPRFSLATAYTRVEYRRSPLPCARCAPPLPSPTLDPVHAPEPVSEASWGADVVRQLRATGAWTAGRSDAVGLGGEGAGCWSCGTSLARCANAPPPPAREPATAWSEEIAEGRRIAGITCPPAVRRTVVVAEGGTATYSRLRERLEGGRVWSSDVHGVREGPGAWMFCGGLLF